MELWNERLTNSRVAQNLKENLINLAKVGIEPGMLDLMYVKLAMFEDREEKLSVLKSTDDDFYE